MPTVSRTIRYYKVHQGTLSILIPGPLIDSNTPQLTGSPDIIVIPCTKQSESERSIINVVVFVETTRNVRKVFYISVNNLQK